MVGMGRILCQLTTCGWRPTCCPLPKAHAGEIISRFSAPMRIVAISDQHGFLPEVPPCDLLIVAGDICPDVIEGGRLARDFPDSQKSWFDAVARPWLAAAPATHKILTW